MARTHDMGGRPTAAPIETAEHTLADWEILADALNIALGARGIRTTDESRRAIEDLPPAEYLESSYYERWAKSVETLLVEKGILTRAEIDARTAELELTWSVS
jgi:nitrile hydratase subunit beta